jgi:hypothetical protein
MDMVRRTVEVERQCKEAARNARADNQGMPGNSDVPALTGGVQRDQKELIMTDRERLTAHIKVVNAVTWRPKMLDSRPEGYRSVSELRARMIRFGMLTAGGERVRPTARRA